jgi:hypothetical protein
VLALALVAAAGGLAGTAAAQPPEAEAQIAAPDSATRRPAPPDDPRNARGERIRPWHQAPWAIMARSGVVPGWGQWTNGRRWKALLVAGAEIGAGVRLAGAIAETDDALDRERAAVASGDEGAAVIARADYDRAFEHRARWAWIVGTAVAVSMLDAYVDAHLLQFDADFGPEPKLIDGDDAAEGRGGGAGTSGVRLGLRIQFQGP